MLNWYRASEVIVPAPGEEADLPFWTSLPFPKIRVPTLVVWAMRDTALLPVQLDGLDALVEDLTVVRVPDAGHFIPWERPEPVLRAIRSLTWLSLALVLLIALATAAAVVLAARGSLDTNKPTIEVMHGVGATDTQIARLFQRKIALDSLTGGLAGAGAAGIVLLIVAGGRAVWLEDAAGGPLLTLGDLLWLAALPLLGTLLATLVARAAVLRALRSSL